MHVNNLYQSIVWFDEHCMHSFDSSIKIQTILHWYHGENSIKFVSTRCIVLFCHYGLIKQCVALRFSNDCRTCSLSTAKVFTVALQQCFFVYCFDLIENSCSDYNWVLCFNKKWFSSRTDSGWKNLFEFYLRLIESLFINFLSIRKRLTKCKILLFIAICSEFELNGNDIV